MTTAEATARARYVAPYDIVEGARAQFKAHVLPRDVQDGRLSDGAERYFGQYYYPTMAGQQVETGVPGTAEGWGHYSVQALNAAKAGYDRDQRPTEPPVTPPPPTQPDALVPLHIDGTTFRRPDGTIWKYRMVTAFTAFQDFLAGDMAKLDAYAAWTRSVGGNGWRIFYTWVLTDFNPLKDKHPGTLLRELESFRRYMDGEGLYSHNTVLCDQVPGSSVALADEDQDELLALIRSAMQGRIVEAVNEAYKNGGYGLSARFPAAMFAGTFGTRSAWADGDPTTAPGPFLACTSEHTPRDAEWPRKAKNLIETSTLGIQGVVSGLPAIAGEPIGIFEHDIPGSRTANASDVADYFAVAELFGAGACLHGDGTTLQRCNRPGPNAQRCAEWAHQARSAVPAHAQLGAYTRGGLDDCPLEHSDSTALRTFAMISRDEATAVVVRPAAGWEPKARNGWRIASVGGPNSHVIHLTR